MSLLLTVAVPLAGRGQIPPVSIQPLRFGVIDITPGSLSGETSQNSEPSLGVGTGANYGDQVVHAFLGSALGNDYYTGPPWAVPGTVADGGATLDWSPRGICYMATKSSLGGIDVSQSTDPANTPFSVIPGSKYAPKYSLGPLLSPNKPWVAVASVTNTDHIYVGFNDRSKTDGKTASVRYSLDSGATWSMAVLEKTSAGTGFDSPAVRLAISADGKIVYALFQRLNSVLDPDLTGDVVLTRDDAYGGSGYGALGAGGSGTLVAHDVILPRKSALGSVQGMQGGCAVAINPNEPKNVYVAYTKMEPNLGHELPYYHPVLVIQSSPDCGATFSEARVIHGASLPALAVTKDGTVGLLYASLGSEGYFEGPTTIDLEIRFLKAPYGNFAKASERVLARFPINQPIKQFAPYIGDYFTLKAINYDFFGTFCASGDPQPSHFPSGVVFLRNVNVGGITKNNFYLTSPGTLVDLWGDSVSPSIDPFFFYDIAPTFSWTGRYINFVPSNALWDPADPFIGDPHISWPVLPTNQPQFELESSAMLGGSVVPATSNTIIETNGQFLANLIISQPQQFYRLRQDLTGAEFELFAAAGDHGALIPSGTFTNPSLRNQTFTARPDYNYAVSKWYLDGVAVQTNGSSLTVSNIADEHTLAVTFVASNDLAVAISHPFPMFISTTNSYQIQIENKGLNLLTGASMSNALPANVSFVSASTTQGTVSNSGNIVTTDIGSLSPGALVSIIIYFIPLAAGAITDAVSVACSQFEPDLSNNTAADITMVNEPVLITLQPVSQTVPTGATTSFTVGVSGTPPFVYQWAFNGAYIAGRTLPGFAFTNTLTVTNVAPADAGSYSVAVFQILGPEEIDAADSTNATLTVGPPLVTRSSPDNIPAPSRKMH